MAPRLQSGQLETDSACWGSSGQGGRLASDTLLFGRESEEGGLNRDVRLRERKERVEKESPKGGSPERSEGQQH